MRARFALFFLAALAPVVACSEEPKTYVHVYVQGSGTALESQPFDLSVVALGAGKRSELVFGTNLHPASGPASRPFTDFLLDTDASRVELRVTTKGALDNVEWGGDVRLEPPGKDKPIVITLTRAESRLVPEDTVSLLDADGDSAALFAGGVALAWSDRSGVRELSLDPDRPVGRGRVVCGTCTQTKVLRVASRPLAPFGPDLYAIAWIDAQRVLLKTTSRSDNDNEVVEVAASGASDVRVACFKKGSTADVVVARLEGGDVAVSSHDGAGRLVGSARTAVTQEQERELVGVLTASDGTIILGVRGATSRLVRLSPDGERLNVAVLPGDLRALGLSGDGNRVLVAISASLSPSASRVELVPYSVRDLVQSAAPATVTSRAIPTGVSLSHVSLSSCALGWTEPRDDGSDEVDVHVQRIDENGAPRDLSFFGNLTTTGSWFGPTVLCASPTRAFATFYDRASTETGNLWLRRLP